MGQRPAVLIVGGGTTGCVLAARLSEDPGCRVLLLEAGPDYPPDRLPEGVRSANGYAAHDWGYDVAPGPGGTTITVYRGKLTGGCSAVNYTAAIRGELPHDYDEWTALGLRGWTAADVAPYFRKLEDDLDEGGPEHGRGGPLPITRLRDQPLSPMNERLLRAAKLLGHPEVRDHNAAGAVGVGRWPRNTRDGDRVSTALAYLPAARGRPNLEIRPGVEVDRLLVEGGVVRGVLLADGAEVRADRVVLAAGAIGSPAILMRSGFGPRAALERLGIAVHEELPGVGQNLSDHTVAYLAVAVPPALVTQGTSPVQLLLTTGETPGERRIHYHCYLSHSVKVEQSATGWAALACVSLMKPASRGQVTLQDRSCARSPLIEHPMVRHGEDRRRYRHGLRLMRALMASAPFAESGVAEGGPYLASDDATLDRLLDTWVQSYGHLTGTCAMGPDAAKSAVVSDRGELRGAKGAYVVDASIMPTIVGGNPMLPLVMIAERLSDHLKGVAGA